MIIQQRPKGSQGLSKVTLKLRFFCQPMLARKRLNHHMWGPIGGPILEVGDSTWDPIIGLRVHMEEKNEMGLGYKRSQSGAYKPTEFCPPWC